MITAEPRTILISGASRGIGRAIAERLLADGHRLSLGLRDPAALSGSSLDPALAGADRTGQARVQLHTYNAEDPATAEAWVASSVNHFGAIDTVVHCAGVFSRATLLFAPGQEQEIQQLWDVNVMGPWWLTRAAWPHLSAHGAGRAHSPGKYDRVGQDGPPRCRPSSGVLHGSGRCRGAEPGRNQGRYIPPCDTSHWQSS